MSPLKNLEELDLKLPEISKPGGSYVSVNIRKHNLCCHSIPNKE